MIEIGKYYKAKPYFALLRDGVGLIPSTNSYVAAQRSKAMKGKCIFAHPKGRFITLEFKFGNRVLRECFRQDELL